MGKGKSGKSAGKALLGIGLGVAGFINPALFATTSTWMGALYGLSLGTTVWSVLHANEESSSSYFDYQMNSVAPNQMIPIVYGTHKVGGLQTYHYTNTNGKSMVKDIVIGEGVIDSVYGVCANNLLINDGAVFKIYNVEYNDATVTVSSKKVLTLYANAKSTTIKLQSSSDIEDDQSNDYCCSIDKLINYINGYGYNNSLAEDGWRTEEVVNVTSAPNKIHQLSTTRCYNNPVSIKTSGLSKCSYSFDNGTNPPNNYTKVGGYKNCAWIRANLTKSDDLPSSGNPNITALVKGRRIVDTRKSMTNRIYSENPAMIVRDYLLEGRFGCGKFITQDMLDEDSFKEVADYCDEQIEYKDISGVIMKEARYTLNIVLNEKKKHIENLEDMFASFGGFLVFTNNKISLRCEKEEPVSYHFSDDNIVLGSVSFSQSSLTDTPNKYQIGYCDHNYNHTEVKVVIDDYADQIERGCVITKDVTLKGCNRQTQAKRLGRLYKSLNRLCSVTIQFQTSTFAMHLEPGDVVTISYKNLFDKQPARITEIQEEKGVWTIKAQQYNGSIYRDSYMEQIELGDYCPIDNAFSGDVPDVTAFNASQIYYQDSLGNTISDVTLLFTPPDYQFFRTVNIFYSLDGVSWSELGRTTGDSFVMHNAAVGVTYYFKAIVENTLGRKSNGVSLSIEITGKDEPPLTPTGLCVEKRTGGVLLSWAASTEPDVMGYNIYVSPNNKGVTADGLYNEKYAGTSLFIPLEQNILYGLYVLAVDNSGNISEPAVITYTSTAPADVEWFDCVVIDSDIDFRWRGETGLNFEIRKGSSWESGTKIVETPSNTYRVLFPSVGEHTFWIKSFDEYRNYSKNALEAIVTVTGTENRNIVKVIDQVKNKWVGGKTNVEVTEDGYLKLSKNKYQGSHLVNVSMPKEFRLRNWIDYSVISLTDEITIWQDAMFNWDSAEGQQSWVASTDTSSVDCKHYIAVKTDGISESLYNFRLNGTTEGDNGELAIEEGDVTYQVGQYGDGVVLKDTTYLGWETNVPAVFSNVFTVTRGELPDYSSVFMSLLSEDDCLQIGYDAKTDSFYCTDKHLNTVSVCVSCSSSDNITIGICQTETTRSIFAKSSLTGETGTSSIEVSPIGEIKYVCCYKKE